MNNSSIVIFQIKYTILQSLPKFAEHLKDVSSFFELYNDNILCLMSLPMFAENFEKYVAIGQDNSLEIQLLKLNTFAKSRLISNFEDKWPELALKVMSCGDESKIIKIKREKNDS